MAPKRKNKNKGKKPKSRGSSDSELKTGEDNIESLVFEDPFGDEIDEFEFFEHSFGDEIGEDEREIYMGVDFLSRIPEGLLNIHCNSLKTNAVM